MRQSADAAKGTGGLEGAGLHAVDCTLVRQRNHSLSTRKESLAG